MNSIKEDDAEGNPTREDLVRAYEDLGDAELIEHGHAVREAEARRRGRQGASALPARYPMPDADADPSCDCGAAHNQGVHSDWCSTVMP